MAVLPVLTGLAELAESAQRRKTAVPLAFPPSPLAFVLDDSCCNGFDSYS